MGDKTLFKALSAEGNPTLTTVHKVLAAVGLRLSVAISDVDLEAVPAKWVSRKPMPNGAIQSAYMQKCGSFLVIDPTGGAFAAWLSYSPTDFEKQTFDRTEV